MNPNYKKIALATITVAAFILSFVLFEFFQGRAELLALLQDEAENLSSSLSLSFENTLASNEAVATINSNQMRAYAFIIEHSEPNFKANPDELEKVLNKYDISHIAIVDSFGNIPLASQKPLKNSVSSEMIEELKPIFYGEYDWSDFGIVDYEITGKPMYLFAQRIANTNRCILIAMDTTKVLELANKISIGKQIQKIANSNDIAYIVLQDRQGIVSASKGINEMGEIKSDTFLLNVFNSGIRNTRLIDYNSMKVYEVASTIKGPSGEKLLNRIGISTYNVRAVQQRSMRRVIIIGVIIFVLFSVLYAYFTTIKGFKKLKKEHITITSYNDLILENIADAVVAIDSENTIRYFNNTAEAIFSKDKSNAINEDYFKVFGTDILHFADEIYSKEIEFTNPEIGIRYLEIEKSYIHDDSGKIELKIAFIKDLTEKKSIAAVIARQERLSALGELAAGVAHEIRNPLNSISVIAQRIGREFKPDNRIADFNKFISTIREEIARVNSIIKQFLEFAAPPKLNINRWNLNDTITECLELIESEAIETGINVHGKANIELYYYYDREKIKQVFINLFRNAIEAMPSGGDLSIESIKADSDYIIHIKDTGMGMSAETASKIFNLYYTTKESGTGLGLSVVHKILSDHGATIQVESKSDIGTTFIITFPING